MGDTTQVLNQLVDGTHPFSKTLAAAKKPMIVLGAQQLSRPDGAAILAQVQKLAQAVSSKSKVRRIVGNNVSCIISENKAKHL